MSSRLRARLRVLALAAWNSLSARRRQPPAAPHRILIAHHLLLGDTLMLTPLLAKLRARYPAAEIVMAAPRAIAPLYQNRPYGVSALPYDPRDGATLRALLAAGGFDLALVPGDNRYSWLARAAGARWIVAFSGDRPAYKSWPVDELLPYPGQPAAWGDMVAGLVAGPPPPAYRPADWPGPDHTPFELPRLPYCVLHVGASSPLKLWPPERWRALADHLAQQGYGVVWSGGRGEQSLVAAIDPDGRYASFAGQLDLAQLWHLVRHAGLLVCPDTGVAHLGRIVDTPTIALFGPGSAVICGAGDFWRDSPYRALGSENFPCRDQRILFKRRLDWVRRCARTPAQCAAAACMAAIGSAEVMREADHLLKSTAERRPAT